MRKENLRLPASGSTLHFSLLPHCTPLNACVLYVLVCLYPLSPSTTRRIYDTAMFRTSNVCAELWKETVKGYACKDDKAFDYGLIYPYYRSLMQMPMPELKPWALFALFVLVFPTGNAISERGFSAMGTVHSKQRSELSVLAHLMIVFNGPPTLEFAALLEYESRQPRWPLYIAPCNFN
jgi:hypothetical protein